MAFRDITFSDPTPCYDNDKIDHFMHGMYGCYLLGRIDVFKSGVIMADILDPKMNRARVRFKSVADADPKMNRARVRFKSVADAERKMSTNARKLARMGII